MGLFSFLSVLLLFNNPAIGIVFFLNFSSSSNILPDSECIVFNTPKARCQTQKQNLTCQHSVPPTVRTLSPQHALGVEIQEKELFSTFLLFPPSFPPKVNSSDTGPLFPPFPPEFRAEHWYNLFCISSHPPPIGFSRSFSSSRGPLFLPKSGLFGSALFFFPPATIPFSLPSSPPFQLSLSPNRMALNAHFPLRILPKLAPCYKRGTNFLVA